MGRIVSLAARLRSLDIEDMFYHLILDIARLGAAVLFAGVAVLSAMVLAWAAQPQTWYGSVEAWRGLVAFAAMAAIWWSIQTGLSHPVLWLAAWFSPRAAVEDLAYRYRIRTVAGPSAAMRFSGKSPLSGRRLGTWFRCESADAAGNTSVLETDNPRIAWLLYLINR